MQEGLKVKDLIDSSPLCPRQIASHSHEQPILLFNKECGWPPGLPMSGSALAVLLMTNFFELHNTILHKTASPVTLLNVYFYDENFCTLL